MKAYRRCGGVAPHILDLCTRWKSAVSFTPRPLYPPGKSPWYPLDRRLGGPQSRSGRCGEEINFVSQRCTTELSRLLWRRNKRTGNRTPDVPIPFMGYAIANNHLRTRHQKEIYVSNISETEDYQVIDYNTGACTEWRHIELFVPNEPLQFKPLADKSWTPGERNGETAHISGV
jgi:hypothetical protein